MLAKPNQLDIPRSLVRQADGVTWNAMLSSCKAQWQRALQYRLMRRAAVAEDEVSLSATRNGHGWEVGSWGQKWKVCMWFSVLDIDLYDVCSCCCGTDIDILYILGAGVPKVG